MVKVTKRSLLVAVARARTVWADIKTALEFKVALWLFTLSIFGLAVWGLTFQFPPSRPGLSAHPPAGYFVRQEAIATP